MTKHFKLRNTLFIFMLQFAHGTFAMDENISSIDKEAISFERQKIIVPISTDRAVNARNSFQAAIDREDAEREAQDPVEVPTESLFLEYVTDTEYNGDQQTEQELQEIEDHIVDTIRAFIKDNPLHGAAVRSLCINHLRHCDDNDIEIWPSEMAVKIGRYFRAQGNVSLAEEFYHLALSSPLSYCNYIYLEMADSLLDYINHVIVTSNPTKPTAEIFSALQKAIRYNSYDDDDDGAGSVGETKNRVLKKHRDKMVRWPWSPAKLINDKYYEENALLSQLYRKGFVEELLLNINAIKNIWSLREFSERSNDKNIFHYLYERGFASRKVTLNGFPQYILMNQKGIIVRVKYDSSAQQWQFTVGLALKNPYLWRDGNVVKLIKGTQASDNHSQYGRDLAGYDFLDECQANEFAKISFDNGLIHVLPSSFCRRVLQPQARNIDYWADYNQSQSFMNGAHTNIRPVGRYNKKSRYPDTRGIDAWCIQANQATGTIN
jgi:hypothetical protein